MPISDSDRIEVINRLRTAESKMPRCKSKADADLYEVVKILLNAVKALAGDQAPFVE